MKELPRRMSEAEAAWVAGLFEGEGWVGLVAQKYPAVMVNMTDRDVVEKLRVLVGAGKVLTSVPAQPNRKTVYRWNKAGHAFVEDLFLQLEPWLCERRSQRFRDVLNIRTPV